MSPHLNKVSISGKTLIPYISRDCQNAVTLSNDNGLEDFGSWYLK